MLDTVRKDGQYKTFILLGGSEGAVIANLVTADIDYIDATIAFNGGGRWFIDDVSHSIEVKHKNPKRREKRSMTLKSLPSMCLTANPSSLR